MNILVQTADEIDCEHYMYVNISWNDKVLAIPLAQIKALDANEDTVEAREYWHYWKKVWYIF